MSDDLLDALLSAAVDEAHSKTTPNKTLTLIDTDIFSKESNQPPNNHNKEPKIGASIIHGGDTDSSDDEDNKYYEERKYNEYGRAVKSLLKLDEGSSSQEHSSPTWRSKPKRPIKQLSVPLTNNTKSPNPQLPEKQGPIDVYTDPVFGLRIINPLVSSTVLKERMVGREAVQFSRIKKFVATPTPGDKNWVIAGVVVAKSAVKTSQKGSQFLIWTLSDLKDDIKTVSMFLFGSAYKDLWKTTIGTVVGILNPNIMNAKDGSKDEACLNIDNAQKVMVLGQSKDYGTCKSTKKSGEKCTAIVNVNKCPFCVYHMKQEYDKCSQRSDLQSSFAGKGLTALRNKVLGKNEVFYAGKSFTAIPAKGSRKLRQKDNNRLRSLNGELTTAPEPKRAPKGSKNRQATHLEVSHKQRMKDLELLQKLGGDDYSKEFSGTLSSEVTLESSKNMAVNIIAKLKAKHENTPPLATRPEPVLTQEKKAEPQGKKVEKPVLDVPLLLRGPKGSIDLTATITPKHVNRAKINALKYIQSNGPLKKIDPNSVKSSPNGAKRPCDDPPSASDAKRQKIQQNEFLSERFKKMMEATSSHMDLLEQRDDEEQAKYFAKLEMKEQLEEKMAGTFKMACKAVRCLRCKYTYFSAEQRCKDERHPLRVFDAIKRFFKCAHCGNRTVCLEIVPTVSCTKCGSGKWERTGMMKEKVVTSDHNLSIRGGEQTFVNSVAQNSNINLLVPDD